MSVLSRYGVTNDTLDRVADYYRFNASRGESWPHRAARAGAVVVNGEITSFRVVDGGVGYTAAPQVSVPGFPSVTATAEVAFTTSFDTNGHVGGIRLGDRGSE